MIFYQLYSGVMESSFGANSYMPPFLLGSTDGKISQAPPGKYSQSVNSPLKSSHGNFDKYIDYKDGGQSYAKPPSLRGPPVQGLNENAMYLSDSSIPMSIVSPERRQLNFSAVNETQASSFSRLDAFSPGFRDDPSKLMSEEYSSPAQIDPFFTRGEEVKCNEEYDMCWITVFGFPPTASSYVLDQFSQYGNILKHKSFPNSNWIHILYQSKLDAKKALSKNGKVFGRGIMVGVQQCIDKSVMNSYERDSFSLEENTRLSTASGIRPLTAAYQASASSNQVVPSNKSVPQKSTGLFSKAVEYIFGW